MNLQSCREKCPKCECVYFCARCGKCENCGYTPPPKPYIRCAYEDCKGKIEIPQKLANWFQGFHNMRFTIYFKDGERYTFKRDKTENY